MSNQLSRRSVSFWKIAGTAAIGVGLYGLMRWYRRPLSAIFMSKDWLSMPALLAQYLPQAEFAGEVSVIIHAPAEAIYAAMQSVTLDDMPIAKWLGEVRYLAGKLRSKVEPKAAVQAQPFLQLVQSDGRNICLAEEINHEYVLGAIGKFHNLLDQQVVSLGSVQDFLNFDQPDYQKLAMSFKLSPLDDGSAHRLTLIHGTHALSSAARRKFALYWLGIKPGGNLVSWLMLRAIKLLAEKTTNPTKLVV